MAARTAAFLTKPFAAFASTSLVGNTLRAG